MAKKDAKYFESITDFVKQWIHEESGPTPPTEHQILLTSSMVSSLTYGVFIVNLFVNPPEWFHIGEEQLTTFPDDTLTYSDTSKYSILFNNIANPSVIQNNRLRFLTGIRDAAEGTYGVWYRDDPGMGVQAMFNANKSGMTLDEFKAYLDAEPRYITVIG